MAIGTLTKRQAGIARLAIRSRRVAAFALHLHVRARQRKACLRVIEAALVDVGGLPVDSGVASRTIASQAALVRILVARRAVRRQAHPGMVQVFRREKPARRGGDVLHVMTIPAAHARMFAIEGKARSRVIESLRSRIPVHHLEIDAVMVGVALHTRCARRARSRERCVKTLVLLDLVCNFAVAIYTLEGRSLNRNLVTLDAVRRPAQALMRLCQRPRRDLRPRR